MVGCAVVSRSSERAEPVHGHCVALYDPDEVDEDDDDDRYDDAHMVASGCIKRLVNRCHLKDIDTCLHIAGME